MNKQFTVADMVACAYAAHRHERFTERELGALLCDVLDLPRTARTMISLQANLERAVQDGWLERAPGPRGGAGYAVTHAGLEAVADVELPLDHFVRREEALDERQREAQASASALFDLVYACIHYNDGTVDFVRSVEYHWANSGWLSPKQVAALAKIAARGGHDIDETLYIGRARPEWIAERHAAEERAQQIEQKQQAERRAAREAREARRVVASERNRKVRAVLEAMYADPGGKLAGLAELVGAVFPERSMTASSIMAAFGGGGSKATRTCIAALAFGVPPSQVWADASHSQNCPQPGADSDQWLALTIHPAGAAFRQIPAGSDPIATPEPSKDT